MTQEQSTPHQAQHRAGGDWGMGWTQGGDLGRGMEGTAGEIWGGSGDDSGAGCGLVGGAGDDFGRGYRVLGGLGRGCRVLGGSSGRGGQDAGGAVQPGGARIVTGTHPPGGCLLGDGAICECIPAHLHDACGSPGEKCPVRGAAVRFL